MSESMREMLYNGFVRFLENEGVTQEQAASIASLLADAFKITGEARSIEQLRFLVARAKEYLILRLDSLQRKEREEEIAQKVNYYVNCYREQITCDPHNPCASDNTCKNHRILAELKNKLVATGKS